MKPAETRGNPLEQIDEATEFDDTKEAHAPLLAKTSSNHDKIKHDMINMFNFDIAKPLSRSVHHRPSKGSGLSESYKDVRESQLKYNQNKVDWMKRFYKYSGTNSRDMFDSIVLQDENSKEHDMEKGSASIADPEGHAISSLYIFDKLVNEMGFPREMAKNVILYDRDIIKDDIHKAVELLIKTDQGWLHTFVPESLGTKYLANGSGHYDSTIEEHAEKCVIWGEVRAEHRKSPFNDYISPQSLTKSTNLVHINGSEEGRRSTYTEAARVFGKNEEIKVAQAHISDIDEEEDDSNNGTRVIWNICYWDHPVSKSFALSWGHYFGINCLKTMFKVNINDGKVTELKWAQYDCDLTYSTQDIKIMIKGIIE